MIPPVWMTVSVKPGLKGGTKPFRLWLPLFLLWLIPIVLSPLVLIALVILLLIFGPRAGVAIREFYRLICSLRGLSVDVTGPADNIRVRVH